MFSIPRKWEGICLFLSPRSLPMVLPCPISHDGRGQKYLVQLYLLHRFLLWLFSLQYSVTFQKYTKQSDWHLSHLCTFLFSPREEVWAKEYLGFEPVYFKLVFLKTGHMRVISPPQTLPDHLLTFNLTWQGDGGLEDKVLWWRRGRRERDGSYQQENLQQGLIPVWMSMKIGPWLQSTSSLERRLCGFPHWGLWQPSFSPWKRSMLFLGIATELDIDTERERSGTAETHAMSMNLQKKALCVNWFNSKHCPMHTATATSIPFGSQRRRIRLHWRAISQDLSNPLKWLKTFKPFSTTLRNRNTLLKVKLRHGARHRAHSEMHPVLRGYLK